MHNVRSIRELNGYSQEYMANRLDISQSTYAKLEKGSIKLSLSRLDEIASILEVDTSTLLAAQNEFFHFQNKGPAAAHIAKQINYSSDAKNINKILDKLTSLLDDFDKRLRVIEHHIKTP